MTFKFDKIALERLISPYCVALSIREHFLYVKDTWYVLKASSVISTCSSANIRTCIYSALSYGCISQKIMFFLKFNTTCVFTGWRIGTFHKVEIDKVIIS